MSLLAGSSLPIGPKSKTSETSDVEILTSQRIIKSEHVQRSLTAPVQEYHIHVQNSLNECLPIVVGSEWILPNR